MLVFVLEFVKLGKCLLVFVSELIKLGEYLLLLLRQLLNLAREVFVRLEMVWIENGGDTLIADATVNIAFLFIMLFLDTELNVGLACLTLNEATRAVLGCVG